ncbi:MAG: hypothetical protein WC763_02545 [Candidatus Paceibacterota bacterium]
MLKQTLMIKGLEECFRHHWFGISEAWSNFFKTYEGQDAPRRDEIHKILERLWSEGFLDKTETPGYEHEYRLTEKAGVYRKPIPTTQAPKPRTVMEQVFEYETALKRVGTAHAKPEDNAILADPGRAKEYRDYKPYMRINSRLRP